MDIEKILHRDSIHRKKFNTAKKKYPKIELPKTNKQTFMTLHNTCLVMNWYVEASVN